MEERILVPCQQILRGICPKTVLESIHTWRETREPHGNRYLFCLAVCGCINPTKDGYTFSDFMGTNMALRERGVSEDQMGIDVSSNINADGIRILTRLRFAPTNDAQAKNKQGTGHRASRYVGDEARSFAFSKIPQVTWVSRKLVVSDDPPKFRVRLVNSFEECLWEPLVLEHEVPSVEEVVLVLKQHLLSRVEWTVDLS